MMANSQPQLSTSTSTTGFGWVIPPASAEIEDLSASELAELSDIYRDLASMRRRAISVDEARAIVATIPLSEAWERSQLRHVGAVRTATRHLLKHGWHSTQIIDPLVTVCSEHMPDVGICRMAVAGGIADWKQTR
jgi:hypothetical protein